jgi:hypothetical protein
MVAAFRAPHRPLGETEAPAAHNIHPGARVSSGTLAHHLSPLARERSRSTSLDSLVVLLWFELPVFALEIIDLACHIRQITLELSHVVVDLLNAPFLKDGTQKFVANVSAVWEGDPTPTVSLCDLVVGWRLSSPDLSRSCRRSPPRRERVA